MSQHLKNLQEYFTLSGLSLMKKITFEFITVTFWFDVFFLTHLTINIVGPPLMLCVRPLNKKVSTIRSFQRETIIIGLNGRHTATFVQNYKD